jgi:hypothetical protein
LSELVTPTARNGGKPPVPAIYQRAHKYARRGIWLVPAESLFRFLLNLSASSLHEYHDAESLRVGQVLLVSVTLSLKEGNFQINRHPTYLSAR